jgi:hypothetical protein
MKYFPRLDGFFHAAALPSIAAAAIVKLLAFD